MNEKKFITPKDINSNSQLSQHPQFTVTQEQVEAKKPVMQKIKKYKFWFIGGGVLIILSLLGTYGFQVYSKFDKIQSLEKEKSDNQTKYEKIREMMDHHSTLINLNDYSQCYQTTAGLKGGITFEIDYFSDYLTVRENKKEDLDGSIRQCVPRSEMLKIDGAEALINANVEEIKSTFDKNGTYVAEAKAMVEDWNVFVLATDKSGGGTLDSETYNNLRNLVAKALGINPSTIGDTMDFRDLHSKMKARLKAVDDKQAKASAEKITQFIQEHSEGKDIEALKTEFKEKTNEGIELEDEISDLESYIKTKKEELFNPFK